MRVLVCGGRKYGNRAFVFLTLDLIHADTPISLLAHGDAPGADTFADQWALDRGVDRVKFPANWKGRGDGAGPVRNGRMLRIIMPDLVVSFPSTGPGTANMIRQAKRAGVAVALVQEPAPASPSA